MEAGVLKVAPILIKIGEVYVIPNAINNELPTEIIIMLNSPTIP